MKQEAPYFEGKNPVLIYIARKLNDALRLEDTFTAAGIDYGVEADEYRGGVVFRSTRVGAFFYVDKEGLGAAHEIMRRNGFAPMEPEDS
jgi:hypothetical protein